ncbi:MAG: hypothetical protein FH758_04070 [Firmicutes bacterium]|nr:hypothetical protein [Bacillota bacterium]
MIKEDPYTGMQYISCYHPDEEQAGPSGEEQMMVAPIAGFFSLLLTLIWWLSLKMIQWANINDEYERAKDRDYSESIECLNTKLKKRGTGVREKYIWEDGKWVQVDV